MARGWAKGDPGPETGDARLSPVFVLRARGVNLQIAWTASADAMNEERTVTRPGLADTLRQRTRALHAEAEKSGIVSDILRGRASRHACAVYLRNLFAAYQALEAGLNQHRETAGIRRLASFRFQRARALADDLDRLCGEGWAAALPLLPAGEAYGQRVAAVAASDANRLLAHAYTRYLADLNGGAVMRRILAGALATDGASLSFLDFGTDAEAKGLAARYRQAIDEAGGEVADWTPVIDEAAMAFRLNIALSRAVRAMAASAAAGPQIGDGDEGGHGNP